MGLFSHLFGGGKSELEKDPFMARFIRTMKLVRHGSDDARAGNFAHAEKYFSEAIRVDPSCVMAYLALSEMYRLRGLPDESLRVMRKCPLEMQSYADSRINMEYEVYSEIGTVFTMAGQKQECLKWFKKALEQYDEPSRRQRRDMERQGGLFSIEEMREQEERIQSLRELVSHLEAGGALPGSPVKASGRDRWSVIVTACIAALEEGAKSWFEVCVTNIRDVQDGNEKAEIRTILGGKGELAVKAFQLWTVSQMLASTGYVDKDDGQDFADLLYGAYMEARLSDMAPLFNRYNEAAEDAKNQAWRLAVDVAEYITGEMSPAKEIISVMMMVPVLTIGTRWIVASVFGDRDTADRLNKGMNEFVEKAKATWGVADEA